MRILVVTKTTNFELHGAAVEDRVRLGRVAEDALASLKRAHSEHYAALAALRAVLRAEHVPFDEISREEELPAAAAYEAVITLGGDGTLLAAAQKVGVGSRMYGVRSSASSVGFLCCVGPEEMTSLVQGVVADEFPTVTCARVQARILRVGGASEDTPPVLNDFLYTNANPAATTRYRVSVGDQHEIHRSSGVWVATAAGSSAAILAAGGQRRPLTDQAFQFRVRELYRLGHVVPHIEGGFFEPERETLEIESRCPDAILALDGQHASLAIAYGDRIRFLRAPAVRLGRPRGAAL